MRRFQSCKQVLTGRISTSDAPIKGLETPINVSVSYSKNSLGSQTERRNFGTHYGEILSLLGMSLLKACSEKDIRSMMGRRLWQRYIKEEHGYFGVDADNFDQIKMQLMALGLLSIQESSPSMPAINEQLWKLTELGKKV
ncbi:MAG: hypothetical protein GY947_22040 [Rhodobacteraceae bacterium]|nr:hypothetical protein [Paracoccaceae bacterium]